MDLNIRDLRMNQHDRRMLSIAQEAMNAADRRMALQMASLPRDIPENHAPILQRISTFLSNLDVARGYSETRGTWPRGVERNHYRLGFIFKNTKQGEADAVSKTACAYVVCTEWTGDCHHQFIPFDIDVGTGVITPRAPIYDYEDYGRPVAIVHHDALFSLQNGWPIATERPSPQGRPDGIDPSTGRGPH